MSLFENFNTTNQTSPHFERHENFVIELREPGCALAQVFDYKDRCPFVQKTEKCRDNVLLFDYTDMYYCKISPRNSFEEIAGVLLLAFMGYTIMGFAATVTEVFFCPPLKVITHLMGISENLAGITLVAFGNSAPDIISSMSSVSEEIGTIYSDNVGSAMFITSFIAGVIIIMSPFHVEPTAFVRDIGFHILVIGYINYSIKRGRNVNIQECIIIMGIYPVYFTIIMLDQYLLVITLRKLTKKIEGADIVSDADRERLKILQMEAGVDKRTKTVESMKPKELRAKSANDHLFRQLLNSLMPIDMNEWNEAGTCKKFFLASRAPIDLVLFALLPAVNYELELTGWSKLLNCIQICVLPAVLLMLNASSATAYGYPIWTFSFCITIPIALVVFLITRTDRAPRFHLIFAIGTIMASICFIRVFTKELINIIVLFGLVTYRSLSFLGCTITSFGDSVGDLLTSILLARHGYQKMGFAACIAGPLFYLTMGLGSYFLYKVILNEYEPCDATQGSMGENCTIFLGVTLLGMLISCVTTNFYLRRSIGFFLVFLYILFNLYCLLGEFQIIHPFGTDHSEDYGVAFM